MEQLSKLMHLRRNHPMDDAIWLLEFVSKTQGAEHLKLSSRHLNLIQYHSLDSLAVILVVLFVVG